MSRSLGLPARRKILELDLTEPPAEPEADPFARWQARTRRQLRPTLRALHEAADDPRVLAVVAKVGGPLRWDLEEELRLGVRDFAASGKPTVAWAETFADTGGALAGYALAATFGELWLQPGGTLGLLGVGIEATFLRGALDRLGVRAEVEQRHEYKNAPDQFTRTGPTPAHREALDRLAASVFTEAVATIATGRRLTEARVRELVDRGPWTAVEARVAGLVDRLGYRDQVLASVRQRVGEAELLFADRWSPRRRIRRPGRRRGHVALVELRGAIGPGRSRRGPMGAQAGSDSVATALRAAAADDQAKAVVFRVDSRGGSAVASESIWREVVQLQETGKPVVVSMGAAAASGGYYVACSADEIVAAPGTLTGSIGVFGGKLVVDDLLDRLGITTARIERGEHASMFSARRSFTDAERARLAALIDAIYADFVDKVAAGRRRPTAAIETIARGRVWTGRDALGVGLVDRMGGLRTALDAARRSAGLPDDAPLVPAVQLSPLARLGRARNSDDPRSVRAGLPTWDGLALLGRAAGTELLMPEIRLR